VSTTPPAPEWTLAACGPPGVDADEVATEQADEDQEVQDLPISRKTNVRMYA